MKKAISLLLSVITIFALAVPAFAASETGEIDYNAIVIGTASTTDENGNEVIKEITLADCEYFDAEGNQADISDAIRIESVVTRSSVTHSPNVVLQSGYMMRYGDYYCTTSNDVTLSCTLGSSAKVAFGYSYTSNPTSGATTYTATSDSKTHSKTFSVPSNNTYYKFYVTNISPGDVTLKTFTISY